MTPNELASQSLWRRVPLLSALLMLLLLLLIDPLLAGAPLWSIYAEGLWLPLAMPWIPWIFCTVPAILAGEIGASRTMITCLSLLSLASGIIPAIIWTLLIYDVAPASDSLWIAAVVALFSGLALVLFLIWLAVRRAWKTRKETQLQQPAANHKAGF